MSKKFKQALALSLALLLMLLTAAGCSSTTEEEQNPQNPAGSETLEPQPGQEQADPDDLTEIVVSYLDVAGNETEEWTRLETYLNTITEPEIGVHVTLHVGQMGDYGTQIPLMLAGGEQLDVVNISPLGTTHLPGLLGTNSLMDCSAVLEEYAPDALAVCGDFADAYRKGDALYGLPTNRLAAANEYVILRKDILEATGTLEQAEKLSSWSELEALYAQCTITARKTTSALLAARRAALIRWRSGMAIRLRTIWSMIILANGPMS